MQRTPEKFIRHYNGSMQKQRGASVLTLLFYMLIGGLFVTCVLKMGPVYLDNWNFRSILNDLESQLEDVSVVDKRTIRSKIGKRLNIDMIDAIAVDDIEIKRDGDEYIVNGDYESRVALLGNIDVVMKFSNETRVPIVK